MTARQEGIYMEHTLPAKGFSQICAVLKLRKPKG